MRLRVSHTTTFVYDEPVSEAYVEMRLTPLNAGGQHCASFRLVTDPQGEISGYVDRFGNRVRHFDTLAPHDQLVVSAASEITTPQSFHDPEQDLSLLDAYDYLQPTSYTPLTDAVRAFAARCTDASNAIDVVHLVMHEVHRVLEYSPGSTTVKTTAEEALSSGRGVCQDFAHLAIATCRALDIPARYVSGYAFEQQRGTSASHAWVDAFVPGQGWVSVDPTHDSPQTEHYVRLAVGRDYADVTPTRGVYKGAGKETMKVTVEVAPG